MNRWQAFPGKISVARATADFICAADELGLILVNGADAHYFLQNQLSNDLDFIGESSYQLSSYSTPKGRLVGIFRIIQISNGYILVTTRSMVLPLLERLYRYVVGAEVTLADASDYFMRFLLQTDRAEVLEHTLLPDDSGSVLQNDSVISLQLEPLGEQRRFLLMCLSADEAIKLWKVFASQLQVARFGAWRLSEIKSGIPAIYPDTSEEFVLQMANLGFLDGVSFRKGCYPGQEIVARMQYLGKLKRRMFLAQLDTDELPVAGDELVSEGKSEADGSGMVVDAELDQDGVCHCLYIARIADAEAGSLHLLKQPETKIQNLDLPYSIDASI
ncbi:MAG: folate-binding protein YgfZ [Gammaproteobacteria bacterium]|nr:folate-binding protein YgfZ [Gammaproteobacteria bacterium]